MPDRRRRRARRVEHPRPRGAPRVAAPARRQSVRVDRRRRWIARRPDARGSARRARGRHHDPRAPVRRDRTHGADRLAARRTVGRRVVARAKAWSCSAAAGCWWHRRSGRGPSSSSARPGPRRWGLSRGDFLGPGRVVGGAHRTRVAFVPLSMWRLKGEAKQALADISAIGADPDGNLWLLSDKSRRCRPARTRRSVAPRRRRDPRPRRVVGPSRRMSSSPRASRRSVPAGCSSPWTPGRRRVTA